jgi:hypothetical protein
VGPNVERILGRTSAIARPAAASRRRTVFGSGQQRGGITRTGRHHSLSNVLIVTDVRHDEASVEADRLRGLGSLR